MNEQALYEVAQELRRLNDALELLFGLPAAGARELPLVREVQKLIDDDAELSQRGVWSMADSMGQAYVCVRSSFMQSPKCLAVDNIEDAKAYLSGVRRGG